MYTNIKYCYLRDGDRGVTIARMVDLENRLVKFAYSVNHPNDQFLKKRGRHIASMRLKRLQTSWELRLTDKKPINTIIDYLTGRPTLVHAGGRWYKSIPSSVKRIAHKSQQKYSRDDIYKLK